MDSKRSKKELLKRYIVMIIGLYFTALAVTLSVSSDFGTSPISTLPNVFSYKFTSVSLGTLMFIWNSTLIVCQILILRRKFKLYQLLQIPLSFVFSAMINLNKFLLSKLSIETVFVRISVLIIGCILLGFAVMLTMKSDVVMNAGEAIVKAVSDTFHKNFGNVKVALDVTYVLLGIIFSLIMFRSFKGVGVGTVVLAVLTGFVVKFWDKLLGKKLDEFFTQ